MKRQHSEKHLKFIRSLPCVCGDNTSTEAAHVRLYSRIFGKRQTGKGEKPDDCWTVPLCGKHHREQHEIGEERFWMNRGQGYGTMMPLMMALALWRISGDHEMGESILEAWR